MSVRAQEAPPPPFMVGAPSDKIEEFQKLLDGSGGLTDAQIDDKVKEWVGQQSSDIQSKFADFEKEKEASKAKGEEAHNKAVEKLSDAAKEADKKLSEIAQQQGMAAQEKAKKITEFVNGLPPNVKEELEKAMKGPQ